ncbi:uncharacterized protein DUF1806 [Staphylococcus saprophyticus]|jgi:hypothetical protein|nr:Protein of uncharacterised function (DUF1806) [Streptococcus equi subsp. equi]
MNFVKLGSESKEAMNLEEIDYDKVQTLLSSYEHKPVYLHVETTNGAYAAHFDQRVFNAGTFLRNIQVTYEHAQLKGGNKDPYRVGLKLKDNGWVYVQGLTHFEVNENDEFLLAGFNYEGQLAAALEISTTPFKA